ncbi:NADH dehydrogenase subunit 2 (mitochondrion) [Physella acuta]|uniref:NADH-ubiquinone oxidoreductase chain 2 n=1 Tax=Physella acuta TaxID=109671 RepID=V9IPM2_PHYAT|nr:NADH dehydrogenase subunit 2 [Physella acuta]AFE62769.1 NADH dehydrogenase subunit 2 [Physella acuta]
MFMYQPLFYFMAFLGQMLSIMSSSWLLVWLMMELSLLTIMPVMVNYGKYLTLSCEVTMKYFIIQSMSSMWIMLGGYMLWDLTTGPGVFMLVFLIGLMFKLGLFPGHFWVIQVVSGLKKLPLIFILSILKLAPLFLMVTLNISVNIDLFSVMGVMSLVVGGLLGIIQSTVRGVLGSSSISHSGWMIITIMMDTFIPYFLAYVVTLTMFLLVWGKNNYLASMMMISFSGLPPFLLFYPKVLVFSMLVENSMWAIIVCLVMMSVVSLYFYLKSSYSLVLIRILN